jgi:hypothetical protein
MSDFSNCQQCGQKLRTTIFCPKCRNCLCCCGCLDLHLAQHTAAMPSKTEQVQGFRSRGKRGVEPTRSAGPNAKEFRPAQ